MIGIPIATRLPSTRVRMIIAATMPTTSLISESSVDRVEPTEPPAATVMPALVAGAVASTTCWASSGVRSPDPMSRSTGAKAVWPSSASSPAVRPSLLTGSVTLATWGTAAIALTDPETACFASSSVSLPVDTSKTIGLTPFCGGGQRSSTRSLVASLSVPAREWRAHHEPSERRQGKPRPEDPRSPEREQGGGIDIPDLGWVFTGPDPRGLDYACLRREVFIPGARGDEVAPAPPLAGIDRDRVSLWWRGHAGGLAGAHEDLEHGQAHDHGREGPPEPLHGDLVAPDQDQHSDEDDEDAQPTLVAH